MNDTKNKDIDDTEAETKRTSEPPNHGKPRESVPEAEIKVGSPTDENG